jgi:hypothetical protein
MKKFYAIAITVSVILFSLWFYNKNDYKQNVEIKSSLVKTPTNSFNAPQNKVIAIDVQKQQKKQNVIFTENLAQAAGQVAMQYENALKFPPYSQPLSPLDEDRLKPNQFHPVSSPIGDTGGALTISIKQYRFTYPEDITLNVSAKGLGKVVVELTNTDTNDILNTYKGNAQHGEANITFKGEEDFPRNLQIFVEADIAGKKVPVVAQIQYMPPSATLTGFENAYAQNENMIVPANLTVLKSGLYRLRANLYSDGSPLAHLVAKQRLSEGSQILNLKAHWSILPEGITDMRVGDFVIERMSPSPGELNSFGNSEISNFDITDFAYDSLQQLPYQANAQEKLSLAFLQGLAEN